MGANLRERIDTAMQTKGTSAVFDTFEGDKAGLDEDGIHFGMKAAQSIPNLIRQMVQGAVAVPNANEQDLEEIERKKEEDKRKREKEEEKRKEESLNALCFTWKMWENDGYSLFCKACDKDGRGGTWMDENHLNKDKHKRNCLDKGLRDFPDHWRHRLGQTLFEPSLLTYFGMKDEITQQELNLFNDLAAPAAPAEAQVAPCAGPSSSSCSGCATEIRNMPPCFSAPSPPSHPSPAVAAVQDIWEWERWPESGGYFGLKCVLCEKFEINGDHFTSQRHTRKRDNSRATHNENYNQDEIKSLLQKLPGWRLQYHETQVESVLGPRPSVVTKQDMAQVHEMLYPTRPAVAPPPPAVQVCNMGNMPNTGNMGMVIRINQQLQAPVQAVPPIQQNQNQPPVQAVPPIQQNQNQPAVQAVPPIQPNQPELEDPWFRNPPVVQRNQRPIVQPNQPDLEDPWFRQQPVVQRNQRPIVQQLQPNQPEQQQPEPVESNWDGDWYGGRRPWSQDWYRRGQERRR